MFVPVRDDNPLKHIRFQYVTVGLIIANVIIFLLEVAGNDEGIIASFAVVPSELFQVNVLGAGPAPRSHDVLAVPERFTLLTYMFMHGSIVHLLGNMLFLWVFGDNVEDALGHVRFLLFYIACGVFAALFHSWIMPDSSIPLVGASGAVAGVIAAYIMLHPRVRVWILAFRFIPLRITAGLALGAWIATQIVMVLLPQTDQIAWWAHIGGLIAGAVLVIFLRKPGVPLFDKGLSAA